MKSNIGIMIDTPRTRTFLILSVHASSDFEENFFVKPLQVLVCNPSWLRLN